MTREAIGRAAVRTYPAEIRDARGDELVGTLLDAGEHSLTAFIGQVVSIMFAGLVARSREASAQPLSQLFSDAIRWAAVMTIAGNVTSYVVYGVRWGDGRFPWPTTRSSRPWSS